MLPCLSLPLPLHPLNYLDPSRSLSIPLTQLISLERAHSLSLTHPFSLSCSLLQTMNVTNAHRGVQPLKMRMVLGYDRNGKKERQEADIANFPKEL